jgi:hypothetical protein
MSFAATPAMTNALPVHRMALPIGARAAAPAAYVRAADSSVERLEQEYLRTSDEGAPVLRLHRTRIRLRLPPGL